MLNILFIYLFTERLGSNCDHNDDSGNMHLINRENINKKINKTKSDTSFSSCQGAFFKKYRMNIIDLTYPLS